MENRRNIMIGVGILLLIVGVYYVYQQRHRLQQNVKIQISSTVTNAALASKLGGKASSASSSMDQVKQDIAKANQAMEKKSKTAFDKLLQAK